MEAWIAFSVAAALAQTARFMLQKQLTLAGLSTGGATFARFVYSAPLVAALIAAYAQASGQGLPAMPPRFWAFALSGGLAQILATMCVVALFSHRNFAVGITFKKTEVVLTALVGFVLLGEGVAPVGALAIGIGLAGVLLLSDPPGGSGRFAKRILNRAAGLGLASGLFFAISAVSYRGATTSLESGDTVLRAGVTLAIVTASQTLGMALWLARRERGQVARVLGAWRVAGLVGVTSMIGSFCWFTAFSLQNAAYVNAVGQVELIFSLAASALFFREKITGREVLGMALLAAGVLVLIVYL